MATAAQVVTNIENARHSTGPRTEEGKARASQNALKHGLTSNKSLLMPGEDEEEFRQFAAQIKSDFAPANTIETDLVDDLVSIQWRRKRAAAIEARILSAEEPDFKSLNNISLIASRLKREFSATLKELMRLQELTAKNIAQLWEDAAALRRADIIHNRTTDLSQFGFVFSPAQIDTYILRKDALESAHRTTEMLTGRRSAAQN